MLTAPAAVVTAASRGMGAACARALAERGYRLLLLARSDAVTSLARELGAEGLQGSVTEPHDLERAVEHAIGRYGRIDAVVHNTGHPARGDLADLTDDDWCSGVDLLFLSVVRLTRLVIPHMLKRGSGALVTLSTFGAEEPSLDYPVSSALRAAVGAYGKLVADRYGPHGIRMNTVLPGFIDSYPVDPGIVRRIPARRPGRVAEVAATVAFLLSDDAGYINGQNIRVDGGLGRSL